MCFPPRRDLRLRRPPLPEIERPLRLMYARERGRGIAALGIGARPVLERDLEQDDLDGHHDEGLHEQRRVEPCSGVVEYPGVGAPVSARQVKRTPGQEGGPTSAATRRA